MKKILVPCDFSKPAINAFRFMIKGSLAEDVVNHTDSPIWTFALN